MISETSPSEITWMTEIHRVTEPWFGTTASSNDSGILQLVTVISFPPEDHLEGLMSEATAHLIQTVVEVGIFPELVMAGLVMNIINMAVFLRQGLSDRINLCLFSLAISDTGYIFFLMITRVYSILKLFDPLLGQFWQYRCLALIGVYVAFMSTSNCLTLLISLERCLLVISPLKARTMLPTRYLGVVVVIIFSTCMFCLAPFGSKFEVITITDPATNTTRYKPDFSRFYLDNKDVIESIFRTFQITVPTIAFVGVAIATLIIAVRMRAAAAWREKCASVTSTAERREASVTKMLFCICVMYTICSIPAVIRPLMNVLVFEFQPGRRYEKAFFTSVTFMHLMAITNSSFNCVIYFVMSTRFRETFKELFSRCMVKKSHDSECSTKIPDCTM